MTCINELFITPHPGVTGQICQIDTPWHSNLVLPFAEGSWISCWAWVRCLGPLPGVNHDNQNILACKFCACSALLFQCRNLRQCFFLTTRLLWASCISHRSDSLAPGAATPPSRGQRNREDQWQWPSPGRTCWLLILLCSNRWHTRPLLEHSVTLLLG